MKQLKTLYFFLPALLLWACSGPDPAETPVQPVSDTTVVHDTIKIEDTTIQLRLNGEARTFHTKKIRYIRFGELQKILDTYAGKSPSSSTKREIDLTGDGWNETILADIYMKNDSAIVDIRIKGNDGSIIYRDRLAMDDAYFFGDFWQNDSVYYQLKPYSAYYHALSYADIVFDEKGPISDDMMYMYLTGQMSQYEKTIKDPRLLAAKKDSIVSYVKNFRGKLITSLSIMDGSLLIWNDKLKAFEEFYAP